MTNNNNTTDVSETDKIDNCCCKNNETRQNDLPMKNMTKWSRFFDYHKLNAKYSALYIVALILDILAIFSLVGIIVGIVASFREASFLMILFTVISGLLGFLILKAIAETIILFIGIEENTSRNNTLLEDILKNLENLKR